MIKIKSRKEYFELSRARRRIVLIVTLGIFIILFAQAVKLAIFENNKLQKELRQRQHRELDLYPYRGKILDRHGSLLAESTPVYSIIGDAARINFKNKEQKKQLAHLLKLRIVDLDKKLKNKKRRAVRLKKNIALAMIEINHSEIGTELKTETNEGNFNCKIVDKPFYDPKKKIANS